MQMVSRAPLFRDVAPRIADSLAGSVFVAHNAGFDWRFVSAELQHAGGMKLQGDRLCTLRLARALVPQVRRRSLDALSWYFGIENSARHRAGGDARATASLLLRLLDEARDRGCETLADLRRLTATQQHRRKRKRRATPTWGDGDHAA
jgi:DNA polymerase-3 subunit epsilon